MSKRVILNFDDTLLEQQEKRRLYDEWFIAEVKRGLHSLETESLHDHEDVMREVHELLEMHTAQDYP